MEVDNKLISDNDLDLHTDLEWQAYATLQQRDFMHTRAFDDELLTCTGMDDEFTNVWHYLGWENASQIFELGSRFLTIQFLCTLQEHRTHVTFRIFGIDYNLTWETLSQYLGFEETCNLNLDSALPRFNKKTFWKQISGHSRCVQPRTNDIHHPTLRLLHKWMAISFFPRRDVRIVRDDEMKLLYAAVNKIKVSPAKVMIKQWRDNFKMTGSVECTSLITRICQRAGALENSRITYLDAPRTLLDMQHLVQGHILKHGPRGSIFYIVADGLDDIRLPNQEYHLYTCQELTM